MTKRSHIYLGLILSLFVSNALCEEVKTPAQTYNYQLYSLADLEALEDTENYQEFFNHALDILPSQRVKVWQSMTKSMAQSYMESFTKKDIPQQDFELLDRVFQYTHLKNDEFFRERRDQFIIKYLSQLKTNLSVQELIARANKYHLKYSKRLEFEFELINLIYPLIKNDKDFKTHLLKSLNPLSRELINSKFSEFYCAKSHMPSYLKDRIYFLDDNLGELNPSCLEKLVPFIKKDLQHANSIYRNKSYQFLKKHKSLSKKEIAFYHTYNLLYGTQFEKPQWDLVIKSLKTLGDNYEYRGELLSQIERMDPYPDYVFKVYQDKKLISLSRIISRYFPEYLDRYAKNCLNYLSGKVKYPGGNPTPNCHRYMEISRKSHSSPVQVLLQYDDIMNSWKKE